MNIKTLKKEILMNPLQFKYDISHFGVIDARCWFNLIPKDETEAIWTHGMKLISEMGMHWDRVMLPGVFSWNVMEPAKGKYDWTIPDMLIKIAHEYDVNIIPVVWPYTAWDQKGWEGTDRKLVELGGAMPTTAVDDSYPIPPRYDLPHDVEAYSKWLMAMVERYDGDGVDDMPGLRYPIKTYQFLNEPYHNHYWPSCDPKIFAKFTKMTHNIVEKANPDCLIALTGVNLNRGENFLRAVFELCKKDERLYFDFIDVHGDNQAHEIEVSTWIKQVERLKELLKEYGLNQEIPLWNTKFSTYVGGGARPGSPETNIPPRNKYQSAKDQAMFLVKASCKNFVLGAKKVVWGMLGTVQPPNVKLSTPEVGKPVGRREPRRNRPPGPRKDICFIDSEGKPRMVYYTMKLVSEKLDSFKAIKKLNLGHSVNAYRYEMGPTWNSALKQTLVLWTDVESEVTLTEIPTNYIKITSTLPEADEADNVLLDNNGNAQFNTKVLKLSKGQIKLRLNEIPIIIEFD